MKLYNKYILVELEKRNDTVGVIADISPQLFDNSCIKAFGVEGTEEPPLKIGDQIIFVDSCKMFVKNSKIFTFVEESKVIAII